MATREDRKFDLILFGATGFTGKLAAAYLTSQYGTSGLKWAIAGRARPKLEKLRSECNDVPEIIIADSGSEETIREMVAQCKVIITAAGPFARYGTPVVQACVELGTDYCDITGESPWVRDMIGLYDDKAKASGARIVHHCGHDCVPWDLMTMMLAKKLKEKGEQMKRVDMYDDLKGQASGGTLETAMGLMFGPESKKKPQVDLGFDPLVKDGAKASVSKTKVENVSCATPGEDGRPVRTMFFMAGVNGNAVKRSNALLHYGDEVTYCEGSNMSGKCSAYCYMAQMGIFGMAMKFPPTRCCILKYLPKPGEGPSEEQMRAGFLNVTGVARGVSGTKVVATIHFPTDPGYKDTARMLVESGLTFVLEKDFKCEGGVYTPAACQGETLLKRLVNTGSSFKYHDDAKPRWSGSLELHSSSQSLLKQA